LNKESYKNWIVTLVRLIPLPKFFRKINLYCPRETTIKKILINCYFLGNDLTDVNTVSSLSQYRC